MNACKDVSRILLFVLLLISSPVFARTVTWHSPSPTIKDIYGMWAASSTYMFCVGAEGTIIHYNGDEWFPQSSGTTATLHAVWGPVWSSVYAVGSNGTILHHDSVSWSSMSSPVSVHLRSVWGASKNDMYTAGDAGTILHYDGSGWTALSSVTEADLNGIWGTGANDIFAVGDNGTVLQYDGSSWSRIDKTTAENLIDVCGNSSGQVFVVSDTGTIFSFEDNNLKTVFSGRYAFNNITCIDDSLFYAVGKSGRIAAYSGSAWTETTYATDVQYYGVCGPSSGEVFLCGSRGTVNRKSGSSWESMTYLTDTMLHAVWGRQDTWRGRQIYCFGEDGLILYRRDCEHENPNGVCESSAGWSENVYTISSDLTVYALFGYPVYARNNFYVAGPAGALYYYEPYYERYSVIDSGTSQSLNGIWGFSYDTKSDDVEFIAAGNAGTLLYCDGETVTSLDSETEENLQGVWGSSIDNVYIVGNSGTLLHYNGSSCSEIDSGTSDNLISIWGSDENNIYAVGGDGTMLHFDGTEWNAEENDVTNKLNFITGIDADTMYAGGNGILLEYDGIGWSEIDVGTDDIFWQWAWADEYGADTYGDTYFVGNYGALVSISNDAVSTTTTTVPGYTGTTTTAAPGETTTTTTTVPSGEAPGKPSQPYPADNATGVPVTATLQWSLDTSGSGLTYDVYFGSTGSLDMIAENIAATFFKPNTLAAETAYQWQVIARNQSGYETQGPLWSFTTGIARPRLCLMSRSISSTSTLNRMREIRDNVLTKTALGRLVVKEYYQLR